MAYPYTEQDRIKLSRARKRLFVGSPATVMEKLQPLIAACQADEIMVTTSIFDHEKRKESYTLLAEAFGLQRREAA